MTITATRTDGHTLYAKGVHDGLIRLTERGQSFLALEEMRILLSAEKRKGFTPGFKFFVVRDDNDPSPATRAATAQPVLFPGSYYSSGAGVTAAIADVLGYAYDAEYGYFLNEQRVHAGQADLIRAFTDAGFIEWRDHAWVVLHLITKGVIA